MLQEEGLEVVGLFSNPNIQPLAEYLRRRDGAVRAAEALGIRLIVKDRDYDPQAWYREIAFRETNRCFHCYRIRLERTAALTARGGFDWFSTTILYSKKQKHEVLRQLGQDISAGGRAQFLYRDFRQGWLAGIQRSEELGLYRQQYCGCLYSELERHKRELQEPDGPEG